MTTTTITTTISIWVLLWGDGEGEDCQHARWIGVCVGGYGAMGIIFTSRVSAPPYPCAGSVRGVCG